MKKPENISSCKNLYPYRRWSLYGPITNIYTVCRKSFVNKDIKHLYCLSTDTIDPCTVQLSTPPVSQHSMLSHYQSETEILNICIFLAGNCNICTFCRKLFTIRDNYHLYRLQKIVHQQRQLTSVLFNDQSIWVSYKTSKIAKKNAFMICLCHSHIFRCSYKN